MFLVQNGHEGFCWLRFQQLPLGCASPLALWEIQRCRSPQDRVRGVLEGRDPSEPPGSCPSPPEPVPALAPGKLLIAARPSATSRIWEKPSCSGSLSPHYTFPGCCPRPHSLHFTPRAPGAHFRALVGEKRLQGLVVPLSHEALKTLSLAPNPKIPA